MGTILAMRILARGGGVVSHEDAARYAPTGSVDREPRRVPAFHIAPDVPSENVRADISRRDSGPAASARRVRSTGVRTYRRDGDRRMRPLQRADGDAYADLRIEQGHRGSTVELDFDAV